MKQFLLICGFLIFSFASFGQRFVPSSFGAGNINDLNINQGGGKFNRNFFLPRTFNKWTTYDSLGMIWIDSANTKLLYYHNGTARVPVTSGGGGGNADSTTFQTNYRTDTMRTRINGQLNALTASDTLQGLNTTLGVGNTAINKSIVLNNSSREIYLDGSGYDVYLPSPSSSTGFGGKSAGLLQDFNGLYYPRDRFTDSTGFSMDVHVRRLTDQREAYFRDKSGEIAYTNDSTIFTSVYQNSLKVPYTGATDDVDLGDFNIVPNSVQFNTNPTGTFSVGQMYWDVDASTVSIPLNDEVNLQVGQESHILIVNKTGVQINDGQVVYINGSQGNRPTVALARADFVRTSYVIGVATENIPDNEEGFITTFGTVSGFNTSPYTDTTRLYLSSTVAGNLTDTVPSSPNNIVFLGYTLNSTNNGKIFVRPDIPVATDTNFISNTIVPPTTAAVKSYVDKRAFTDLSNAANGGTTTTVLHGNASGAMTFAAVDLAADVSGNLPVTNLNSGTGATNTTFWRGDGTWATPPSASAAGSSGQIQYNDAGAFAGASQATIGSDGNLVVISNTATATPPSAGSVKVYANNRTGVEELRVSMGSDGDVPLQNSLGVKLCGWAIPTNGAFVANGNWQSFVASTGSLANVTKAYDATNLQPNYSGLRATSAATTNAVAAFNVSSSQRAMMVGNNANGGGAKYVATFAFPTWASTERVFVGYYVSSASPPLAEPSTLVNVFAIAKDGGDATLQLMHNDAAGTCTKVNTGITPNVNDVYRVTIYIPSNSTSMYATIEDITKSSVTVYNSGAISSNIPPAGTALIAHCATGTGAATTAVTTLLIQMYEEQY